jgi:O-antigen/teichoic acid export membrane protein
VICIAIFISGIYMLELFQRPERTRLLAWLPLCLMTIAMLINQFVFSWATYLRCHKQEPFLVNSIVGGILCGLSTLLLGKYFGVMGITAGYGLITIGMMPWGYYIFKSKKQLWHQTTSC